MTIFDFPDVHTHREPPYPEGVISLRMPPDGDGASLDALEKTVADFPGQPFSIGIHPWDTLAMPPEETFSRLESIAQSPNVVAIGECGVDTLKGGSMYVQLPTFRRQVEISERLGKPLVIHEVKGADIILGLHRDLKPTQPWIIHGFRGKPALAKQLAAKGIYLSFGKHYNEASWDATPPHLRLRETDESIET